MRITKERKKDGSTRYLARPTINGVKRAVRATTKAEVERKVAELKEQQRRRRLGLPDGPKAIEAITFDALCDKYLSGYTHKDNSKTALVYNLRHSRAAFGKSLVRDLTYEQLRKWYASLAVGDTTKGHVLAALRSVIHFGIDAGYATSDPSKNLRKPKPRERKHPFESWEEVRRLANGFEDPAHRRLVLFVAATGLRPQEWQVLRWSELDTTQRVPVAYINRTLHNGKVVENSAKTNDSLRRVELNDLALEALGNVRPLDGSQLVFPGERGGILNLHAFRRKGERPGPWTKALDAARLAHRSPSQLRHTYATLLLSAGIPPAYVSQQLGHKSIETTLRYYAKWIPSDHHSAAVNAALAAATGLKADSGLRAVTG